MPRYRSNDLLTAGTGSVIASTTAPVAHLGQRWFNTATAVTYQYTIDAAGTKFWLDISGGGIGAATSRGVDFVGDTDPHLETNVGAVGSVYYNREADRYFVCTTSTSNSQVWAGRHAGSGGEERTYKLSSSFYRVHTFKGSGTFTMDGTTAVDYLVVGGGGGAGSQRAGGGGAGGFRTAAALSVVSGTYSVTVGNGGLGGRYRASTDGYVGANGTSSIFSTITATGGGGGGGGQNVGSFNDGEAGGSGGGGGANDGDAGGSTAYGNDGGAKTSGNQSGGGGGGAGAAGATGGSSTTGGAGGIGENEIMGLNDANSDALLSLFSVGVNVGGLRHVAGGGGGGSVGGTAGAGGGGGGGTGTNGSTTGGAGTTNTGSGGAGGGQGAHGGIGGSGIVILRYLIA